MKIDQIDVGQQKEYQEDTMTVLMLAFGLPLNYRIIYIRYQVNSIQILLRTIFCKKINAIRRENILNSQSLPVLFVYTIAEQVLPIEIVAQYYWQQINTVQLFHIQKCRQFHIWPAQQCHSKPDEQLLKNIKNVVDQEY